MQMNIHVPVTKRLADEFGDDGQFTLAQAYAAIPDKPKTTVRGRIYERLGKGFERIGAGLYRVERGEAECLLLEGDGRDLSLIPNGGIDCIITDHPWNDTASNKGGNRDFCKYESFRYTLEDFVEKARVLKTGHFCVEILPEENAKNVDYLNEIKQMAKMSGLQYYAKVPWIKTGFVSNTGRKASNSQDVMIFVKGNARALRPDAKKDKAEPGVAHYMSGAAGMLPTAFHVPPVPLKQRRHPHELPMELIEQIIDYVTLEGEYILDQFAGSGTVGQAALQKNRGCILIEKAREFVNTISQRLQMTQVPAPV